MKALFSPTGRGLLCRVPGLVAVALVILSPGCLFPPVGAPVDVPDPGDDPEGPQGPTVYRQMQYQNTTTGRIEAGISQMDVREGGMPHAFDLPPRLDAIRLVLDWDDEVYDLDLSARLLTDPEDPDDASWEGENETGTIGEPDSPAKLSVTDRSQIQWDHPTQLRVNVYAEAGVDVEYTLTVSATYLVPAGTVE